MSGKAIRLSEYRRMLAKLARQCKGVDPIMAISRFSDLQGAVDEPVIIEAIPQGTVIGDWIMRTHPSMTPDQLKKAQTYILIGPGN